MWAGRFNAKDLERTSVLIGAGAIDEATALNHADTSRAATFESSKSEIASVRPQWPTAPHRGREPAPHPSAAVLQEPGAQRSE